MKKQTTKNQCRVRAPEFVFGAEFEGAVKREYYNEFCDSLKDIHPRIRIGSDGSLCGFTGGYRSLEIRTPALTVKQGIKLFENILCHLFILTKERIFETNSTCGLHLNFSERKLFKQIKNESEPVIDEIRPTAKSVDFYLRTILNFDEDRISGLFNRQNNEYARLIHAKGKKFYQLKRREHVICYEKYQTVAFRPVTDPVHGTTNKYRVEFRCLGNTNYQIKHKQLKESFEEILNSLNKTYDSTYHD